MRLIGDRRAVIAGNTMTAITCAAIALAISIAFGGWAVAGGNPVTTRVETLRVFPESRLTASTGGFSIVVKNTGNLDTTITMVRIGSVDYKDTSFPIAVKAGSQVVITGILGSGTFNIEKSYEIHVYTATANDYLGLVVAS